MFVPLHVKSDRSPEHGAATVEELVRAASAAGLTALGLTDLENLYAAVEHHERALAQGLHPIHGVELRAGYAPGFVGERLGRLVLLARDLDGYETLCRVLTARRLRPGPTLHPTSILDASPRGLFYASDDVQMLQWLLQAGVAPGDVRYLLVRPGGRAAAPPAGIRVIADPDVVLLRPDDVDLHRLQVAIRTHRLLSEVRATAAPEQSLEPIERIAGLYRDVPEAIEESQRVAEACAFDLMELRHRIRDDEEAASEQSAEWLTELCAARLEEARSAGRFVSQEYDARLDRELSTLRHLGYTSYFARVEEVASLAREMGIPLHGRGSAGGSFVAHLLGLTALDPVAHGLYFERFVHSHRRSPPDIDLDVPSHDRDALIDRVLWRHGPRRAAMIAVQQSFDPLSALRAGLKALGMHPSEIERFCADIPGEDLTPETWETLPLHRLPEVFRRAAPLLGRLVGKFQHLSVHPGGIVFGSPWIDREVPLERAPKGVQVTQYDMHALARLGYAKLDLLGNRALGAIHGTFARIGRAPAMPDGDTATVAALREARTIGCFRIETPTLRSTLRRLPVRSREELAAAVAIVRPGPSSGEAKARYERRAQGEEPSDAPHPLLEPILAETRGMLLYEEQLVAAIAALTGWTLERADDLRDALAHGATTPELRAALAADFMAAAEANGVSSRDAFSTWLLLEAFAASGFNKTHALSDAQLAWATVFLKSHYPAEFACGVLESYGGLYPLRTVAADVVRQGVRLFAPHVEVSAARCRVEDADGDRAVRLGLESVKRLSHKDARNILRARPFMDLADFLARVPLGHAAIEALVLIGACDGLRPLEAAHYPRAHQDLLDLLGKRGRTSALQEFQVRSTSGPRARAHRDLVRIRNELRFLDMHPSNHPMRVLRDEAARVGCVTTLDAASRAGIVVTVAGIVSASWRVATRSGRLMQFVTLEDEVGLIEASLLPEVYAALGDPIRHPGPFLVRGRVEWDRGDATLAATEATPFHERPRPYGRPSW